MIIEKITKSVETNSMFPDTNWYENNQFFVVPDDSTLAHKILNALPTFDVVVDNDGNLIDVIPTIDIVKLKAAKKAELEKACNDAIRSGFWSEATGDRLFYGYDNTETNPDQSNLDRQWAALSSGLVAVPVPWKPKGSVPFQTFDTIEKFKKLYTDALTHLSNNQMKYFSLMAALEAATTQNEVEVISWDTPLGST